MRSRLPALLLLFLSSWVPAWPVNAAAVELTAEQKAYVLAHGRVSYCVDPDWEPFEVISTDGRHAQRPLR